MKTRRNYIVIASCIGLFALSADALSSKSDLPVMNQEVEVAGLSHNDSILPEIKPYYTFTSPAGAIEFMMSSDNSEEYARGILPQMANEELSYVEKLLNNDHDGFIVVDKNRMKVIKFNRFGVEEESFGMACAKNYGTKHTKGDSRTPEGFFSVKQIQNSTDWHYVDDNGVVSEKTGEFGPRFIRLNIPGITSIGIHGTSAPWSIGGRRSHGCIRLTNENILHLVDIVEPGMPVIITPGKKDMAVNKREGYNIPSISTLTAESNLAMNQ
ncbi:MAG: L,D-transpeptidase [Muribaculaceae bacterium]|nr:L,D-transpeptidase [Muribaculaceae bacterium]